MRLRLKLVFERKAEMLAAYPWEFIFMPLPDQRASSSPGRRPS